MGGLLNLHLVNINEYLSRLGLVMCEWSFSVSTLPSSPSCIMKAYANSQ